MSDIKAAVIGKKVKCLTHGCDQKQSGKGKAYFVCTFEIQDPALNEFAGQTVEAFSFQPFESGKGYEVEFSPGSKEGTLSAKRKPSTDEERAARKAKEAKEKEEYEKEMARTGGDSQAAQSAPAASLVPTESQSLLAKKYGFTPNDVMLMEQNGIIPRETPLSQVNFFFRTAELMKLNPLLKQVYLLPFGFGAKKGYAIVVAIDSMRSKAIATNQYGGKSKILFDGLSMADWIFRHGNNRVYETREVPKSNGQKSWKEFETHLVSGQFPATASVVVTRIIDGKPYQFEAEIAWDEYYPGVSGRGQMWRDRPFGQLGKCCEAIALRMAFADSLSKMYVSEEMDKKAAESEVVDVPHLDWDTLMKEISACNTEDDVIKLRASKDDLIKDGEYQEALQIRIDEIRRATQPQ